MLQVEYMDEQCLTRRCLTFPLLFLCLGTVLPLITMVGLHVGLHGSHASRREAIGATGETHLIMFMNMIIDTHGEEVGIYVAACQQHLRPTQSLGGTKIPKTHCPRVPKAIWVTVGHVHTILTLAHEHDSVYGYLLSVGCPRPFCRLLEGGSHLSVEFGGVTTLQLQYPLIGSNTEHILDDSAGVCFGYLDVVTVVVGVDGTQVSFSHLIASVFLEALKVSLVADLANHVEVLLGPLTGVGHHLDRR